MVKEKPDMRTLSKFAAALAVAIPLMAASGTAQARDSVGFSVTIGSPGYHNGYGYYDDVRYRVLPPGVIRQNLRGAYYEVSRPERRGDVYLVRAEDRRGRDLVLTVNAYNGRVIAERYTRRDDDRRDDRRDRWDDRNDRRGDHYRGDGHRH
jgi:hypothetical protein